MEGRVPGFYDALAAHYHLIFDDWDAAIHRQAAILASILGRRAAGGALEILDCACGIGTQALGLAALGHSVTASDLSPAAVSRARHEAETRALSIAFHVSDMTALSEIPDTGFDAVIAMDNALPHLTPGQLAQAASAIARKLKPDGLFLASIRDYDTLVREKPHIQSPAFYGLQGSRRIVHQVWDWLDDRTYLVHLYITSQAGSAWETSHFVSEYHCLLRAEASALLIAAGFENVEWLMPPDSGYYQPIVLANAPHAAIDRGQP